jgi:hypothetical protein
VQDQRENTKVINPRRRLRRRLVAAGLVAVGVCSHVGSPPLVLKGTTIPAAWAITLVGAVLLLGELMGFNVFRSTPLDNRRDAPQRR